MSHSRIEKVRFSKKRLFVSAALIFTILFGAPAANADDPQQCFTVSSLEGPYSVIGNYGANVAIAFGRRYLDGKGNLTGTFVINEPLPGSTTGQRKIVTGTQVGTYTVNCDGTGIMTRVLTVGTTTTLQYDNFLITGGIWRGGKYIATAIVDAQQTPSTIVTGGIFLVRTWTRLPDQGE